MLRRCVAVGTIAIAMTLVLMASTQVWAFGSPPESSVLEVLRSEPRYPALAEIRDPHPGSLTQSQQADNSFKDPQSLFSAYTRQRKIPQAIFYPDDRIRVSPTVSTVAFLVAFDRFDNPLGTCSGVMIGPRMVLAAGHCIHHPSFGGFASNIVVVPGADGSYEPFGVHLAQRMSVPNGWANTGHPDWDWGFVTLPTSVGNVTGWEELGVASTQALLDPNLNPVTIGYPADKSFATQWATAQQQLADVTPTHLINHLDAYPGQSGSAVFRPSDARIIGIMSGETPGYNVAVRVHEVMILNLLDGCADLGCTFSAWIEPAPTPTPSPSPTPTLPAPTPTPTPTATVPSVPSATPTAVPTQTPPQDSSGAFNRTWSRTDRPVADTIVNRTWMWGPHPFTGQMLESYVEASGGQRTVVYYDKSRMEITTDPNISPDSAWYVTNGLLATELITGRMQIGHNTFSERGSAQVNVAGDPDDAAGPTYATFRSVLNATPVPDGSAIIQRIDRNGNVSVDSSLAGQGVYAANRVQVPGLDHQVASPFWEFMNSTGMVFENGGFNTAQLFESPFYATGYPITEAYWARVKVAGTYQDVLMQCFERRCLTYTPGNSVGWAVEAGNIGQHYYRWRHSTTP